LFSAPPGRKQPYRAPQSQNNQNASGNVIAGMHGAAFGASIAAFPRRISRDPLELWSRLQRSAVTPLPNVKCSCISDSGQTSWAEQKKLLFHRDACALQSRSGLIADVRFVPKADIGLSAYPQKRTLRTTTPMSALCQKQTSGVIMNPEPPRPSRRHPLFLTKWASEGWGEPPAHERAKLP
jgi:hypothetical protein